MGSGKKFMKETGTRAILCLGTLNLGVVCGWGGEVTPPLLGSVALGSCTSPLLAGFSPLQYTQHANCPKT